MPEITTTVVQSVKMLLLMTFFTGLVYPLVVTGIAQVLMPDQANGSILRDPLSGTVLGSRLLGQEFTSPRYFWGRLSATEPPCNPAASSGSNLSPTNPALTEQARARFAQLAEAEGTAPTRPVAVDLVTASGSGLDPHVSIQAAEFQIPRVARARGLGEETVRQAVLRSTEPRQFGIFGEPRVNVLLVNLDLDNKLK